MTLILIDGSYKRNVSLSGLPPLTLTHFITLSITLFSSTTYGAVANPSTRWSQADLEID